jgi:hypothetical protein
MCLCHVPRRYAARPATRTGNRLRDRQDFVKVARSAAVPLEAMGAASRLTP